MLGPEDIVAEARRWIGTPYRAQQSRIGRATDCPGLVFGAGEYLALFELSTEIRNEIARHTSNPSPQRAAEILSSYFTRHDEDDPRDGVVVWIAWVQNLPIHLAITATYRGRPTLIHALHRHGVVENGFAPAMRRRVHSCWRYPGVRY